MTCNLLIRLAHSLVFNSVTLVTSYRSNDPIEVFKIHTGRICFEPLGETWGGGREREREREKYAF